ncbi:MEDS domain-containing protein [Pseudonocardia phyllosphaerae]|uniref:MEDS domain-containing protein n=1 Tax=Pseudonocardia phyllosphaerae TaxID=3390502 RepID=UPI0039792E01
MTAATPTGPALRSAFDPPAQHVLTVPVSDEQRFETTAEFLAGGLVAGERVTFFDDGSADDVLGRMHDDGVDLHGPLRSGQLQLAPPESTRHAVTMPLDEVPGLVTATVDGALADGWSGLRFTGETCHALTNSAEYLLEHDHVVATTIEGRPARVLCVYDRLRFPERVVADMCAAHTVQIEPVPLYDDSLLRITTDGPARVRLAGEVDHANRPQVRRVLGRLIDRLLRGDEVPDEEAEAGVLVADLSALRFCDVAAAVSVVHAAAELPVTLRLRLDHVRPGVARLLDRCGSAFAPQLDVRVRERSPLTGAQARELGAGAA